MMRRSVTVCTGARVEKLTPLIVAGLVVGAFQVAFRFARPSRIWPVAIVLILVGTAIGIWFDQHGFTASSPYPFALMMIVPAIVVGAIAHLGHVARWPWPVTTIVGLVAGVVAVLPMWIAGCYLAAAFGVPGCHF